MRACHEIDLSLLRVHPRVHRDLACHVRVGATRGRLLNERRVGRASAGDRDHAESRRVLVGLDERAERGAQAVDELLECAGRRPDHTGHAAVVRKESLAHLHTGRLGDAVAVRDARSAIESGVGSIERYAVLPESGVLLLDELEIDLWPAAVMHDEQIRLRAFRARDRVERRAHGSSDARDDVRRPHDETVRLFFVELRDLEALVEELDDIIEPDVFGHVRRSVRIRFTTAALALRPSFPITAPTSAPSAIVFPALYAATAAGFASIASSTAAAIALSSLT